MRKQTFLYRLDTQEVPSIQRKHLNGVHGEAFAPVLKYFPGFLV
jgi:hypothetical protein